MKLSWMKSFPWRRFWELVVLPRAEQLAASLCWMTVSEYRLRRELGRAEYRSSLARLRATINRLAAPGAHQIDLDLARGAAGGVLVDFESLLGENPRKRALKGVCAKCDTTMTLVSAMVSSDCPGMPDYKREALYRKMVRSGKTVPVPPRLFRNV